MKQLTILIVLVFVITAQRVQADNTTSLPPVQDANSLNDPNDKKDSSWLITPLVSSDPKISTAAGVMVGYVHQFDEASPPSLFGLMGTYSTTDSYYYGGFAKTHFGRDRHRITAGAFSGRVKNDYSDFLGSGLPAQTTDDLRMLGLRYVTKVHDHWYLGPQFFSTNYAISADDAATGEILDEIGLTGFQSNGLGLVAQYDSRDNQYFPARGQVLEVHNIAFRRGLGGDVNFDAYHADYQVYVPHGKAHVLAIHAKGRWTAGAPSSGYSSVDLRGYTRGQYLAPHMTLIEFDERFALTKRWGLTGFLGAAVLYGGDNLSGWDRLFPAGGIGTYYQLNEEKMVVRAEYALGKEGNQGFYLQFGQPF